jgi:hypothetical protein
MPAEPDDDDRPVLADRFLARSDLRRLPTPKPLITNVLDEGTTALLYGSWSTGKSFLSLDWAASVATGLDWMGRPVSQRRVLYIAAEGARSITARIEAWELAREAATPEDGLTYLPHPVNLTRAFDVGQLVAAIEWGGFGFIVLDTLARSMLGGDENSAKDPGLVIDAMSRLLAATPDQSGVVLAVHHTTKDGRTARGSTAFEAGVDTAYRTERDGAVIKLDRQKRRDGPEFDRHQFLIEPVPGTTSAVLSVHEGADTSSSPERLLSVFNVRFPEGQAKMSDLRSASGMANATFKRAVDDLVEHGRLVKSGTSGRPILKRGS